VAEREEGFESLDPTTVAILAHGLLNNLGALNLVIGLLLRTHQDADLVTKMADVVDGQVDTMVDTLRLLARGLPEDVLAFLSANDGRPS
jgi:hypothetical protein